MLVHTCSNVGASATTSQVCTATWRDCPAPAFSAVAPTRRALLYCRWTSSARVEDRRFTCCAQVDGATRNSIRRQLTEVAQGKTKPAAKGGKRAVPKPTPKPKSSRVKPQKAAPKPHKPPLGHSKPPKSPPPKTASGAKQVVGKPTRGSRKGATPVKPPTRPPVKKTPPTNPPTKRPSSGGGIAEGSGNQQHSAPTAVRHCAAVLHFDTMSMVCVPCASFSARVQPVCRARTLTAAPHPVRMQPWQPGRALQWWPSQTII